MHNHNYTPREQRLMVMNDREIQEVARCYGCRGHHIARFACGASGFQSQVAVVAAIGIAIVVIAICAF